MFVICRWEGRKVVVKGLAKTRHEAQPLLLSLQRPNSTLIHGGHFAVPVEDNQLFDMEYLHADMKRQRQAHAKAFAEISKNDPPIVLHFNHPAPTS